jgi:hypothetical protein
VLFPTDGSFEEAAVVVGGVCSGVVMLEELVRIFC